MEHGSGDWYEAAFRQLVVMPMAELDALGCFCSICDDCGERQVCLPCAARGAKLARSVWDAHDDALGL